MGFSLALGGIAAETLIFGRHAKGESKADPALPEPELWIYHAVDPMEAAKLAYEEHATNGCSYSVFHGILSQLAEKYREPYRSFPFKMMEFGNSGVGGYGSTCGGLVGAAAAIGLFLEGKARNDMITHLFKWYENTELPTYRPSQPIVIDTDIPAVMTQSILCRNAKSVWCKESGFSLDSKERRERCYRLSGDIGMKTAELLNAAFGG